MPWALPARLRSRGLEAALSGERALFSAWRPQRGPPSKRGAVEETRPALIELCRLGVCAELGDKKRLAMFLERCGLTTWAPLTILLPEDMSRIGESDSKTLWFLKHARKERNEGVSVHLGPRACHNAWISEEDQDDYIAQCEVPRVLLDEAGRKLTFRIYLLLMSRGHEASSTMALVRREFICRSHPAPYDAADPNPARHVHSTLDTFEGVEGRSSRTFAQAAVVWPAILNMLQARSFVQGLGATSMQSC